MIFTLVGCSESSNKHEGEAKTPSGSSVQKGRDYQSVVDDFVKKGFINIKTEALDDLITGWLTKDGEVESVSVDGDEGYSADVWYPNDVEVVITYHTFAEEDVDIEGGDNVDVKTEDDSNPLEVSPPYNTKTANGLNYIDVVEAFEKAGFTNISVEKRFVTERSGYEENTIANIYINNSGTFKTDRTYNPDSEVRIDYYVISKPDEKSETELTQSFAQSAFEDYAENQYPYGFKCHWILDLKNAEQWDDGSWFFKVGVTITNQYGTKYDSVAEGVVSGTDQNPKIERFYVDN